MCPVQVKLILPDALVRGVDEMRGDVSRSRFVQRVLERGVMVVAEVTVDPPSPKATRSPEPPVDLPEPRVAEALATIEAPFRRPLRRHAATCSCPVCKPPRA